MKATKIIALAALTAAVLSSCSANKSNVKVEEPLPTSGQVDSVSYLIGVNFGYFIKANNFADKLSDINMSQLKKGMLDFINAKGNPGSEEFNASFAINPDDMNEVFNDFISKRSAYKAAVNKAESEQFLEKVAKEEGVVKTESGLLYRIVADGSEVKPAVNDTIQVKYTGTTIKGEKFDGTEEDAEPAQFVLGGGLIAGWNEGIPYIGEGGKIMLYVPAELAYGERASGPQIGPNSALVFEIELVKVGKAPVEAAEEK